MRETMVRLWRGPQGEIFQLVRMVDGIVQSMDCGNYY